ncbi:MULTISPECIES: Rpn family recombination-promoting nuclease/putative transposase [unclassified Candidatus Tisiphia]|jgi:predicted transposase/invertase (TIGR01784 family)|uniref:Rpn family recombination-promoting nuclease/putative transposase n=1 Tax=unclassified Candidatus Tisiphia TaxID=2996318 RepID=UPI00312CB2AE
MQKYLDPTNDSLFKKIFSDLERLKEFLNSVLDLHGKYLIKKIKFIPSEQLPKINKGKRSAFDLKVEDESGNQYIIEMQKKNETDYLKRVQYYSAHSYVQQLKQGMTHNNLLPILVVSLIKNKIFGKAGEDIPYISSHKIIETTTNTQHFFDISYVFIELGKFNKTELLTVADEWLHLFKHATEEDSPPKGIKSSKVLEAYQVIDMYGLTPEEYDLYIRCKLQEDAEDIALAESFQEGEARGEARGEERKAIIVAKEMLIDNEPIEKIVKYTKLTLEEIEKLKEE